MSHSAVLMAPPLPSRLRLPRQLPRAQPHSGLTAATWALEQRPRKGKRVGLTHYSLPLLGCHVTDPKQVASGRLPASAARIATRRRSVWSRHSSASPSCRRLVGPHTEKQKEKKLEPPSEEVCVYTLTTALKVTEDLTDSTIYTLLARRTS